MALDYTDGCVNFRDVGAFVNLILGEDRLPEGRLYRGGSTDYVFDATDIGSPGTIFNLRNGHDPNTFNADYAHFPMFNKVEKYDTAQPEVRTWLNQILCELENPEVKYPLLIHCLSGKDRTGIVVAAILLVLGIDRPVIQEEYLLSDGEVQRNWVELALDGMGDVEEYFGQVDLEKVRRNVLGKTR